MKPTEILKQEHRTIERMLNILENAVGQLEKGEKVSPEIFNNAVNFIKNFADRCHHGKEEEILFPAMEAKGFSKQMGPVAVMLYEHDLGRKHIQAMTEALTKYNGGDSSSEKILINNARSFISLLRQHIQKEDNILFVMADQHFSEIEQEQLLQKFEEVELKIDACVQKKHHISTLESLEKEFLK